MKILVIFLLLLVAMLLFAVKRNRVNSPATLGLNGGNVLTKSANKQVIPRNPYRATSIMPGEHACDAVRAIVGKLYLDKDRILPKLSLVDCEAGKCRCKYVHHEDRREDHEDRRLPRSLQSELYDRTGKLNRRTRKRGRRKSDLA